MILPLNNLYNHATSNLRMFNWNIIFIITLVRTFLQDMGGQTQSWIWRTDFGISSLYYTIFSWWCICWRQIFSLWRCIDVSFWAVESVCVTISCIFAFCKYMHVKLLAPLCNVFPISLITICFLQSAGTDSTVNLWLAHLSGPDYPTSERSFSFFNKKIQIYL